jgi:hypothetical protein
MCTVAAGQRDFKGAFLAADAFDRDPISARFLDVVPEHRALEVVVLRCEVVAVGFRVQTRALRVKPQVPAE